MSDPAEHPPSPPPVPWPFRTPHPLEPSHYLYNRLPHDQGERLFEQSRRNPEGNDIDGRYTRDQTTHTRIERTHRYSATTFGSIPPSPRQHQHGQSSYDSFTDLRSPRGGPERWSYLGRNYERDGPNSEWVEMWKPTIRPVTDIYGIPEGDPLYKPHLRYTPPQFDSEDTMRGQDAMRSTASEPTAPTIGGVGIASSLSGAMYDPLARHMEPVGNSSASRSIPQTLSPLAAHSSRPLDMRKELGRGGHGHPGSSRGSQPGRHHDLKSAAQLHHLRDSTDRARSVRPDTAQPSLVQISGCAPDQTLETREDSWEFLFGSKGYVTLAPGDERPAWWKD